MFSTLCLSDKVILCLGVSIPGLTVHASCWECNQKITCPVCLPSDRWTGSMTFLSLSFAYKCRGKTLMCVPDTVSRMHFASWPFSGLLWFQPIIYYQWDTVSSTIGVLVFWAPNLTCIKLMSWYLQTLWGDGWGNFTFFFTLTFAFSHVIHSVWFSRPSVQFPIVQFDLWSGNTAKISAISRSMRRNHEWFHSSPGLFSKTRWACGLKI